MKKWNSSFKWVKRYRIVSFVVSINIANFEAFLSVLKLTKNPLFLKSAYLDKDIK